MHSPRRCSHPSKNSTRPQPHHVTVAVAPLPFPPVPLVPSDRLRCQSRPFEIRLTGAPASRLSSTVESVTPIRPLPAGGCPILPGLRSPSRSFPEAREPPRSLALAPYRPRNSKNPRRTGAPFRTHETCASRATLAASLRRAISGGDCIGMHPKTLAVATWHQTSGRSRRISPTGKHRHGRSRMTPRIEALHRRSGRGTGFDADGIPSSVHRESRTSLVLSRA
jgi:hypothetical protein